MTYYDPSQYAEATSRARNKGIFANKDPDCVYLAGYDSIISGWYYKAAANIPYQYWEEFLPEIFNMGVQDAKSEQNDNG